MTANPQLWLAAFITIGIYSFLWKENPLQKIGEYMIVGMGVAHSILMGYQNVKSMAWEPMVKKGVWYMAIPLVLGLLLWTRWFKRISYLSRPSISLLVGVSGAVALRGALDADLFGQLVATIRLPLDNVYNWILIVGVVGTLTHFMYILPGMGAGPGRRNFLGEVLQFIGVYLGQSTIMIALGAAFAYTIMGRVSVVIGRVQFLFRDWIYLIPK
ncbi:MAG: hypothetical protein Q8P31_09620 [Bacillota bacterium]|nr:hypothetical protein [Bacillota bacterium]